MSHAHVGDRSAHALNDCIRLVAHLFGRRARQKETTRALTMECDLAGNSTGYKIDSTLYVHQPCVLSSNQSYNNIKSCHSCERLTNRSVRCAQFCERFGQVLPPVYASISSLSALCCLGVVLTYIIFPRLRQTGYSSKVFLYR